MGAGTRSHPHARWLRERSEKDLAADTFRMVVRANAAMLPPGALAEIFVEVLGDPRCEVCSWSSLCKGGVSLVWPENPRLRRA